MTYTERPTNPKGVANSTESPQAKVVLDEDVAVHAREMRDP